ncbi:hypothetical protein K1719_001396 [Acacia pycnantha]|nr:hypothetical protein K1719_001396 [Acacia pycnantha]
MDFVSALEDEGIRCNASILFHCRTRPLTINQTKSSSIRSASSLRPIVAHLLNTTIINHRNSLFLPCSHFSSAPLKKFPSDETLLRVIEPEIRCTEDTDSDDHDRVEDPPNDFPFEIIDSPGQQIITLKRTYQGEDIKVEVHMPDLVTGGNEDDRDDDANESERATSAKKDLRPPHLEWIIDSPVLKV